MSELSSNTESPFLTNKILQSSWEDITPQKRQELVEKYGEPVTIEGVKFEINEIDLNGVCNANEKSLGAMEQSKIYWGYYSLAVINNNILRYNMAGKPRVLSSQIIKGSEGGLILPGMIYSESDFSDNEITLGALAYEKGTHHEVFAPGERGSFTTYHLPKEPRILKLTPVRELGETFKRVTVNGKSMEVNAGTVKSIIEEAQDAATLDEDRLYANLRQDLPAYFEDQKRVQQIRLKGTLVRNHEVGDQIVEDSKGELVMIPPGTELPAIVDPVAFNNHGYEVYIVNHGDKYYFCPKRDTV